MDNEIKNNCHLIISELKRRAHQVFPPDILDRNANTYLQQDASESLQAEEELTRLKKLADLIIVETSKQSIGIGQEIALSLTLNKPVVALYHQKYKRPHILQDEGKNSLLIAEYNGENLPRVIDKILHYANKQQDSRFNFFINPKLLAYLDLIARSKRLPRAVFLRKLIEDRMKQDVEYLS